MGIIQINMSSSCLKLLLALTLFVIITECRPNRRSRKECKDDDDCSPGFSCIQTRKKGNVCAKARPEAAKPNPETDVEEGENHNADATNGDEDDGDALVIEDEVPENDEADADYPEGNDVDETDNTEDDENDEDDGTDYPDGENPSDEPDDTEVTEDDAADYPEGEGPSDEPDDTEEPEGDENDEDDAADYPEGEGPSDKTDDTEAPEDDEKDEHDDADYPEDEGIDVPFDESDEGDENNEDDAADETDETEFPDDDENEEDDYPLQVEDDANDFTEFAGNNEGGPRPQNDGPRPQNDGLDEADENEVTDVYPTFPTENPIGEEESSDAGDEMAATDFPPQMKESDSAQQGRSYKRVRAYGGKEGAMKTYGCHEKINSILKKVLKKLKMSQAVENKAYEMVEEMMMERDIDMELEY